VKFYLGYPQPALDAAGDAFAGTAPTPRPSGPENQALACSSRASASALRQPSSACAKGAFEHRQVTRIFLTGLPVLPAECTDSAEAAWPVDHGTRLMGVSGRRLIDGPEVDWVPLRKPIG